MAAAQTQILRLRAARESAALVERTLVLNTSSMGSDGYSIWIARTSLFIRNTLKTRDQSNSCDRSLDFLLSFGFHLTLYRPDVDFRSKEDKEREKKSTTGGKVGEREEEGRRSFVSESDFSGITGEYKGKVSFTGGSGLARE